jgi:hypothetical protein
MGMNPGDNEHSLLREDYISVYGDADRFVVTSSMNTIEISTDSGVNWSSTTDTSGDVTLTAAASTPLGLIVVGEDAHIRTSRDGAVWRRCSSDATGWLWDATATSWGAVIVGEMGTVLTSTDLVTWTSIADATTETLTGIAWADGRLVAVGSARTVVTSSDGQQWTQTDSGMPGDFYAVTAGAGRFVAVGKSGIVGTSADGTVWQPRTSGTTTDLNDIAFTGTVFVAVGGTGTVLTSPDGVTWSPQKSGTTSSLLGVTAYGGMVVAVGDKGTIVVSQDATGWIATPSPTREILYACAALDSTMIAVGGTSTVLRSASLAAPAIPQTVRPIASAVVDPASIVLEWNVAARALSYDVEVAGTPAFAKTIVSRTAIAGSTLRLESSGLPTGAPLYWRVRARGVVFASAWTPALAFTIRATPPPPTRTVLVLRVGSRTMTVDGVVTTIDVAPQIVEGRTLLPVKWVTEPLGATVSWDGTQRKVSVSLGQKRLELWIGKSQALVNGIGVAIDSQNAKVVPLIISSRTMLPVRFVAEQLGADVQWEPTTRTITITYARS